MFELAPRHKFGLSLKSPVMPASGAAGYSDEYSDCINYNLLGAFVTNAVSYRPRKTSNGPRLRVHHDHLVVHTGLPNPGVKAVIRKYRKMWERMPVPVIVHLVATTQEETRKAALSLSQISGVVGIELGLIDRVTPDQAVRLVRAAAEGDHPIIVRIPFDRVDDLAPLLAAEGASALTLTAPPRVVLPPEAGVLDADAKFYRGRLYGPVVYPLLLGILSRWARTLPVPIIACGGIQSAQEALACLTLGATAVQIDAVLWRTPTLLDEINAGLTHIVTTMINDESFEERE